MTRLLTRCLLVAAIVVSFAACDVDVAVEVEVEADGSGAVAVEVIFDPAAVETLERLAATSTATIAVDDDDGRGSYAPAAPRQRLVERLQLGDLTEAGWAIEGPINDESGSVVLRVTKAVPSRDRFGEVLAEIAGPGVFTDVAISHVESFAQRRHRVAFEVDLGSGWALLSDAGVAAALDGEPFGVPIEQLTEGRPIDDLVQVSVTTRVSAADGATPTAATWQPRFDDPAPTRLVVEGLHEVPTARVLRWIAYALTSLFALSLLLAVVGLRLDRRAQRLRPRSTPAPLASRVPGAVTAPPAPVGQADPVRLVVIEPRAVFYDDGDKPTQAMLEFVRSQGSTVAADQVEAAYDSVITGRISTTRFWAEAGIEGDPDSLDQAWVSRQEVRRGTVDFLRDLERGRIPIAALTDDAATWSHARRDRDGLASVWPWLVSSDLTTAKPDAGVFEILRRETGAAFSQCLYVDCDVANLDAARTMGMRTARLVDESTPGDEPTAHATSTSLPALARTLR